jgi:hypothetical protein
MLKRNIWYLLLIFAFSVPVAFAQNVDTSAKLSAESAAVLKALSVPVSKDLKQKITFSTEKLKVQGNWAFVAGRARNAEGGTPNWKLTRYQEFIDSNDFEDNLFALLKKTDGKWRVVTYMMNCHDVCYLDWPKRYKAPKAIIEDSVSFSSFGRRSGFWAVRTGAQINIPSGNLITSVSGVARAMRQRSKTNI